MTTHEPQLDQPVGSATHAPANGAERVRDAEAALAAFYDHVVEIERSLAGETQRADAAEARVAQQGGELVAAEAVRASEAHLRDRVAELDHQIARAHEEIQALHNSRTMRAVAIPRRIYAKLRAMIGRGRPR